MFSKFKLQADIAFEEYHKIGQGIYDDASKEAQRALDEFINVDGIIDGTQLQEQWFPLNQKYDVFLSHSHADEDLAIGLAGFLSVEMGLSVFIDSCLWGYANELLRTIDNRYCLQSNGETYNYSKRNYSTSHVHMMLSIALTNMMDSCEAMFFLNTPNTISLLNETEEMHTMSPWIYHELSTSKIIRTKPIEEYRQRHLAHDGLFEAANAKRDLDIAYNVNSLVKDLIPVSGYDLMKWADNWKRNSRSYEKALDILYMDKGLISFSDKL